MRTVCSCRSRCCLRCWRRSATAAPFAIGAGRPPDVAVDAAGTAYIAWNGPRAGDTRRTSAGSRAAPTACDVALTLPSPRRTGLDDAAGRAVAGARVRCAVPLRRSRPQITLLHVDRRRRDVRAARGAGGNVPIVRGRCSGPATRSRSSRTRRRRRRAVPERAARRAARRHARDALDATRPYNGDGRAARRRRRRSRSSPTGASHRRLPALRRRGDLNDDANWSAPVDIGYLDYPRLAGGPRGPVRAGRRRGRRAVRAPLRRRRRSAARGARSRPATPRESALFQDAGGRLHAVYPRLRRRRLPRRCTRSPTTA